jgi:hypothetical protein
MLVALVAVVGAAQTATDYSGTWTGTWEGPGTGQFELTLEKSKDGAPSGKVAVTTDGGNYNADLKGIAFDGNRMTAKYDFPLDPSAEVGVTATFEDRTAKGTWALKAKGQDAELASGTFTIAKK